MRALIVIAALFAPAFATLGVDVSSAVSDSAAKCIINAGFDFAVVRAWRSFGSFDPVAPGSVAAFWAAGAQHVDVYAFPCAQQSASGQANSLVVDLTKYGVKYGMVWIDVETNPSPGCGWALPNATDANATAAASCTFMGELVSALKTRGVNVGTYASRDMWTNIMGAGCTVAATTPLWYPHYDGNPSFSDFAPFGGWAKPAVKQFADGPSVCGTGVDHNFY